MCSAVCTGRIAGRRFGSTRAATVLEAIARALASGCLVGTYERHDTTIRADEGVLA
jgi:hypothetical protein